MLDAAYYIPKLTKYSQATVGHYLRDLYAYLSGP